MIKTFEKYINSKYNVGDYVLLTKIDLEWGFTFDRECKVISNDEDNYQVITFDKNEEIDTWISTSDIIRKLTPEEIENYKIRKESEKYNL